MPPSLLATVAQRASVAVHRPREGRGMKKTPRGQRPGDQKANVLRPAGIAPATVGGDAAARADAGRPGNPGRTAPSSASRWASPPGPSAGFPTPSSSSRSPWSSSPPGRSPTAPRDAVTKAFGDGFWSLIPFTMQMAFVTIGGYVVATSPPAQRLIDRFALVPRTGRGAVGFIAAVSMLASLLSWGLSLIFGGLLARAIATARRPAHGLPRRGCRRLSRPRRHLGAGPELVRGPAPGQCREPAQVAAADHRRDPVHRDDLPLAVDGHRRWC